MSAAAGQADRPPCTWCGRAVPPPRKPPLPAGFCSGPCMASYRAACADLGAELHRHGAITIENLHRRFHDLVVRSAGAARADDAPPAARGPSLADQTPAAVKAIALTILAVAAAHWAGWV